MSVSGVGSSRARRRPPGATAFPAVGAAPWGWSGPLPSCCRSQAATSSRHRGKARLENCLAKEQGPSAGEVFYRHIIVEIARARAAVVGAFEEAPGEIEVIDGSAAVAALAVRARHRDPRVRAIPPAIGRRRLIENIFDEGA